MNKNMGVLGWYLNLTALGILLWIAIVPNLLVIFTLGFLADSFQFFALDRALLLYGTIISFYLTLCSIPLLLVGLMQRKEKHSDKIWYGFLLAAIVMVSLYFMKIGFPNDQTVFNRFTVKPTVQIFGWQTYDNGQYALEYPYNWKIKQNIPSELTLESSSSENSSNADASVDIETLHAFYYPNEDQKQTDMDKWLMMIRGSMKNVKETTVGGQPALYVVEDPSPQSPGSITYYLVKDGNGYAISIIYPKQSDGVGEKIVSTFKFTK